MFYITKPTPESEFTYISERLPRLLSFYRINYPTSRWPKSDIFESLCNRYAEKVPLDTHISTTDRDLLMQVIRKEYSEEVYIPAINLVEETRNKTNESLQCLKAMMVARGISRGEELFKISFTLYGPGGSYDHEKFLISLLVLPERNFPLVREASHIITHEATHIYVEHLVKAHNLTHFEKESLVNLICLDIFKTLGQNYFAKPEHLLPLFVDCYYKNRTSSLANLLSDYKAKAPITKNE